MLNVSIILAAAGLSVRMGGDVKKPYLPIKGRPIIQYAVENFLGVSGVRQLILVVGAPELEEVRDELGRKYNDNEHGVGLKIVPGGRRRQDSIYQGLKNVDPQAEIVLVHDAVRPIVTREMIESVIDRANASGAAILAVPVNATVKEVEGVGGGEGADVEKRIVRTVDRGRLWLAQTPQGFRRDILQRAYDALIEEDAEVTDDAQAVERLGHPVEIVPGSHTNIKITTPDDLPIAEALLS